jgi:serine/threonine protein phosphatase 1
LISESEVKAAHTDLLRGAAAVVSNGRLPGGNRAKVAKAVIQQDGVRPLTLPSRFPFKGRHQSRAPEPGDRLVYAIGDIHGRDDLLAPLLEKIGEDVSALKPEAPAVVVFLGDYVDRGAASKLVIERIITLRKESGFEVRSLKGNHEAALLAFLSDPKAGPAWAEHGGSQTLASYSVSPPNLRANLADWDRAREQLVKAMSGAHLAFLNGLELTATYGDYLFVHAGVRPGTPLSAQRERDLLWIREEFLRAKRPFDKVIVHGHTPEEAAFVGTDRIGVDTGAYATGLLTAVRLNGADRTLMQVRATRTG